MLGEACVVGEVTGVVGVSVLPPVGRSVGVAEVASVGVAEGASVGVAEGASVGAVSLHPASPTTTRTSPTTSLTLRQ